MKNTFRFAAIAVVLGSVFSACQPDIDKSDPFIDDFFVNNLSGDTVNAEAGQALSITAELEDNDELNQLRFSFEFSGTDYYYPSRFPEDLDVIVLGLESYQYANTIWIPDTVPDSYWNARLKVIDGNGNEAEMASVVRISNSFLPKIQLIDSIIPGFSGSTFSANPGDTLSLQGSISDEGNLDLFQLEMRSIEDSTLLWTFEEELSGQMVELNNLPNLIALPTDTTGSYHLYFIARDVMGYEGRKRFQVNISD